MSLIAAIVENGWVLSDVSWNNEITRIVEFSAHHATGVNTYVVCHESCLVNHLQKIVTGVYTR
jgi:hypothetical protein